MSKNNLQVYLHIVFTTKNRNPLISEKIEAKLFPFIWAIITDNSCTAIMINGMPDHVHVLLKIDSKISIANLVKYIKGKSSRFLNENFTFSGGFEWQRGYGVFSVSAQDVDKVAMYIKNQKMHHKEHSGIDRYEL
jgi:putative transposase